MTMNRGHPNTHSRTPPRLGLAAVLTIGNRWVIYRQAATISIPRRETMIAALNLWESGRTKNRHWVRCWQHYGQNRDSGLFQR